VQPVIGSGEVRAKLGGDEPYARGGHSMREAIEPRKVYTLQEARKLLALSDTTFRLLVRREEIKGRKAGRQWRFVGSALLKFFEDGSTPSTKGPR